MSISQDKILEIRSKANIVEIISEYVPLIQKGKNYFGICPFHDDHNPSMSVSPEKQIYTCFVCGAHGNVFSFIMDYENLSFVEAVKIVGNKVGVKVDVEVPRINKNINEKQKKMFDIYDIANKYYQNQLNTSEGKRAREYLKNRDIDDDIIKEFEIGLSTKSLLTDLLIKKGYSDKELLESGITSSNNDKIYDTFSNRIMFPLYDIEGKVVGFSGRIFDDSDNSKYVNSKESEIFKKSKIIYNYHKAKDYARREKYVIITEGFMDVIALYKRGIKNVVATMGTAITSEHIGLIKKISTNVILCFDGDNAGEKATISCSNELIKNNVMPKIIRLRDKLDPDDFIKKYGVDKFKEEISNALSYLDYKVNYYKNNTNFDNSEEVSDYIKNVLSELKYENDKVIIEIILKRLSDDTNVSVVTLNNMLKNEIITEVKPIEEKKKVLVLNKYDKAERRLIFYMLRYPEVIKIYDKNKCFFPTQSFRYLVNEILDYYKKYEQINIADFISHLNDKKELLDALSVVDVMNISDNYSYEEIMDYINLLNDYNIEQEIKRLTNLFKSEINSDKKTELAEKIAKLKVRENNEND
ncbi:MAG: DNA primase [Bacilli bacterium]|nr:DNA primase [Bacilli bacterium]